MSTDLVSIVMPFKDVMPFFKACLQSIVDQSYQNWELLAVDDGSHDDSRSIVSAYAAEYSNIHHYTNSGNGIIQALRTGWNHTQGKYITRMDADDIMAPNRIGHMVSQLKSYGPKHIATGLVQYFNEQGLGDGYQKYEHWLNGLTIKGDNFKEIYKECSIPSPCWMMYRSDFDHIGGFGSDRYPEDYDLAFRMYHHGLRVIPSDQILHHWRDYPHRTSRTHENYADNRFLELKVDYFLEIDHQKDRPLVLWGAGKKGKLIAQLLIARGIHFIWVTDNPKKIGKEIYSHILQSSENIPVMNTSQTIVAVAGEGQKGILKTIGTSKVYPFC